VAAYIVLGVALIGRELENPFGNDVNDLDMEKFIHELRGELKLITSLPPPKPEDFITVLDNCTQREMGSMNLDGQSHATTLTVEIRTRLKTKAGEVRPRAIKTEEIQEV
jgi:ion channel-forming bestrophin family protein